MSKLPTLNDPAEQRPKLNADTPFEGEQAFWKELNGRKLEDIGAADRAKLKTLLPELPPYKGGSSNGGKGAHPDYLRATARRRHLMSKINEGSRGGRARRKFNRAEIEEQHLQRLMPKALAVLEQQLDDPDQAVRQRAAVKVFEYVKGKPTQRIDQNVDQVSRIVYESAAYRPPTRAHLDDPDVIDADVIELPSDDDGTLTP